MSNEEREDFFKSIEELLELGASATNETIENNAFEYIKSQKHILPNKFLSLRNKNKKAIFMAGGSGAGKSETALTLIKELKIDIIDTDNIRKICPMYSGANSHLFQKASSKGVATLLDYAFKNELSFILDGNFAEYHIQKKNIERAFKRGYSVEIVFVYRDKEIAKEYTRKREKTEGRVVPDNVFEKKYIDSIETTKSILGEFDNISFMFVDLTNRELSITEEGKKKFNELTSLMKLRER